MEKDGQQDSLLRFRTQGVVFIGVRINKNTGGQVSLASPVDASHSAAEVLAIDGRDAAFAVEERGVARRHERPQL